MWTQADIDALQQALGMGVRRVKYPDGSEIEYRSLAEMRQALAMMETSVAGGGKATGRAVLVRF